MPLGGNLEKVATKVRAEKTKEDQTREKEEKNDEAQTSLEPGRK